MFSFIVALEYGKGILCFGDGNMNSVVGISVGEQVFFFLESII